MKTTRREALKRAAAVVAASVAGASVAVGGPVGGPVAIEVDPHDWLYALLDRHGKLLELRRNDGLSLRSRRVDEAGNGPVSQVTGPSPHEVSGRMIESGIGEEWLCNRSGHDFESGINASFYGLPVCRFLTLSTVLKGGYFRCRLLPVGGLFRPVSDAAQAQIAKTVQVMMLRP